MFFLIGLGLGDPTDVGVLGQQIIKRCERVYLEAYTSILLNGSESALEDYYGKKIQIADREQVEVGAGDLLENADTQDVALLVVGDPLSATTHTDLMLRAKNNGIPVQVLSNASVLTAAATTGLRLERFGEVVSIPYWEEGWKPDSFYDKIEANLRHGLHTLCLLDIKVKEQTVENIIKKRKVFEPPRFMRTHEAALQLLSVLQGREGGEAVQGLRPDTPCVACVRLGTERQQNLVTTLQGMSCSDLGEPLHSMVVCAPLTAAELRDSSSLAVRYSGIPATAAPGLGHLYLVGIGLTLADLTAKGLAILLKTDHVFLEEISRQILRVILGSSCFEETFSDVFDSDELKRLKEIFDLETRGVSATHCEEVLALLKSGSDVAVVAWGDPLVLTDLPSLLSLVSNDEINFSPVHNASIINTVASCGLQPYSFGEVICFPEPLSENEQSTRVTEALDSPAFYKKLLSNLHMGLHSLCILHRAGDNALKYWRPSSAAKLLLKLSGRRDECAQAVSDLEQTPGLVAEPAEDPISAATGNSCESAACASRDLGNEEAVASQVSRIEEAVASHSQEWKKSLADDQRVVVVRLVVRGQPEYRSAALKEVASMENADEEGLYALIIVGKTHPLEEECLVALTRPV